MKRIFVYEYLSGGGLLSSPGPSSPGPSTCESAGCDAAGAADMLAMGQAMRDAVAADLLDVSDYEVSVATCDRAAPVSQRALSVMPREAEVAFDFVARQADAHNLAWVIAPETDGLLAEMHRRVDPARWLGCDAAAIKVATGKRGTLSVLDEAGITTPHAFEHAPETTHWVVKPDDGAGSIATRLHASFDAALEDWSQRSRSDGAMAIEPWVDGQTLSLSLLCSAARTELLSINRQQLAIDALGQLSYRGVQTRAMPLRGRQGSVLNALAARIGHAIAGLRGFVGVDLVWHARRGPVVIEVNPRVTCAYVGLSHALGRNLAADVLAIHLRETRHGNV